MIYHLLAECEIEALLFSMAVLQDNEKKKLYPISCSNCAP